LVGERTGAGSDSRSSPNRMGSRRWISSGRRCSMTGRPRSRPKSTTMVENRLRSARDRPPNPAGCCDPQSSLSGRWHAEIDWLSEGTGFRPAGARRLGLSMTTGLIITGKGSPSRARTIPRNHGDIEALNGCPETGSVQNASWPVSPFGSRLRAKDEQCRRQQKQIENYSNNRAGRNGENIITHHRSNHDRGD